MSNPLTIFMAYLFFLFSDLSHKIYDTRLVLGDLKIEAF